VLTDHLSDRLRVFLATEIGDPIQAERALLAIRAAWAILLPDDAGEESVRLSYLVAGVVETVTLGRKLSTQRVLRVIRSDEG
jgi:hypothetical protein